MQRNYYFSTFVFLQSFTQVYVPVKYLPLSINFIISGDIALDDISIIEKLCSNIQPPTVPPIDATTPPPTQWDCDFETNLCGYVSTSSESIEWKRIKGPTPTQESGPETDHTTLSAEVRNFFMVEPCITF